MTWVLDGEIAPVLRSREWLGLSIDRRVRDVRNLPWWWTTIISLQKRWDNLQERSAYDIDGLDFPRDYKAFVDPQWCENWFASREDYAKDERQRRTDNGE